MSFYLAGCETKIFLPIFSNDDWWERNKKLLFGDIDLFNYNWGYVSHTKKSNKCFILVSHEEGNFPLYFFMTRNLFPKPALVKHGKYNTFPFPSSLFVKPNTPLVFSLKLKYSHFAFWNSICSTLAKLCHKC